MYRKFSIVVLLILTFVVNVYAAYDQYQVNHANRIYAIHSVRDYSYYLQDCNFCLTGWYYIFADCWTYFDPVTEYTDHYQERCADTGCYHECTATREVPSGTVIGIWNCHILVGSCSGCN